MSSNISNSLDSFYKLAVLPVQKNVAANDNRIAEIEAAVSAMGNIPGYEVVTNGGTHTVTFTGNNGTTSFTVYDGTAPACEVVNGATSHTVTFTGNNGTTSFTVYDGAAPACEIVNGSSSHTVTFTGSNGSTSFTVLDGEQTVFLLSTESSTVPGAMWLQV